jgi:hypothetical protein
MGKMKMLLSSQKKNVGLIQRHLCYCCLTLMSRIRVNCYLLILQVDVCEMINNCVK